MSLRFRYQTYCADEEGRLSLTDAQDVTASSFGEAARKACGGEVLPVGPKGKLAVKVWQISVSGGQPTIRTYYRP